MNKEEFPKKQLKHDDTMSKTTTPLLHKTFTCGIQPYHMYATVILIGDDLNLTVGGSEGPHIGAIAVATPCTSWTPGKVRTATASVICVPGHMDDSLARRGALKLATALNTTITVALGIHLDNATEDDIKHLSHNFDELIQCIEAWALQCPQFPTTKSLVC